MFILNHFVGFALTKSCVLKYIGLIYIKESIKKCCWVYLHHRFYYVFPCTLFVKLNQNN